jgi:hypothetical protein
MAEVEHERATAHKALVLRWRRKARVYEAQALGQLIGSAEERVNSAKASALMECASQLEALGKGGG